jgi:pimeloyl-ACP methyl ester carboxylesterase
MTPNTGPGDRAVQRVGRSQAAPSEAVHLAHERRSDALTGFVRADGCLLYYEQRGEGVPILLIPPAGTTASTWGPVTEELARVAQVITYDRRGYARSADPPVRTVSRHTADAATILEHLATTPAIAVGTSAGATIAVDLAVQRPDLLRAVVAHEAAWRANRQVPNRSQLASVVRLAWLSVRKRHEEAAETLLRAAYSYREGGTAWDAFPDEWRRIARENARAALWDFRNSIGNYPSPARLATLRLPVVCSYGARSPRNIVQLTLHLAAAIPTARTREIPGAGHAAPFDATSDFVQIVTDVMTSSAAADRALDWSPAVGPHRHAARPRAGDAAASRAPAGTRTGAATRLEAFTRWLYRGGRPNSLARTLNTVWARVFATGRGPAMVATLEVVGRRSGNPVRLPVVVADLAGERYLVSMLGEGTNWVRNVRADGHRAVLIKGQRTPVRLDEVPVAERAPIIKRYCQVATSGRVHIPVDPTAPVSEFEAIADQYPVFRIVRLP